MDYRQAGLPAGLSAPVRVQRNGNSRVLPIPADIVRAMSVEFGEMYSVEIAGDDVIYHRTRETAVAMSGSAGGRFGLVPDTEVSAAPQRSAAAALDWDF